PSGGPNWSVLVKLKNSPAMISLRFSLTFVLLRIERSSLGSAGPRSRLQQYCPMVPKAGVANAAVLNQWSWLLIPALGSPMRLALPPKGELPFRESVPELTPKGIPPCKVKRPPIFQPPNILAVGPLFRRDVPG